jgi:DNA-binding NtrC family response regulator
LLVLVVDDDPKTCAALRRLIEIEGHTVLEAYSALDAVELIKKHWLEINVLIVDFYLGGTMTGEDVAKHTPRGTALFCMSGIPVETIMSYHNPIGGFLAFFPKPIEWDHQRSREEPREGLRQWLARVNSSLGNTPPQGTKLP